MPDLPETHAIFVMILTVFGIYLFSRDWISIESSSLTILVILVASFYLFPYTFNGNQINPIELFFIKSSKLIYSNSTFGNFSKENIFFKATFRYFYLNGAAHFN